MESGPLDWVYRVADDEKAVLLRASTNYAARGFDPLLAAAQAKREARMRPPDPTQLAAELVQRAGPRGSSSSRRRRAAQGSAASAPAVPYESTFTGRGLVSALPVGRHAPGARGADAALAMTRGPALIKPELAIAPVPGITAQRPKTDALGVVLGRGGVQPADAASAAGGVGARRGSLVAAPAASSPFEHLHDVALVPVPAAQLLDGGRGAARPLLAAGALTRSLAANSVGRSDPCPAGPARHRGGAGLITGVLTVPRDAMVPAALVIAKWGQLIARDYGRALGDPATFTLQLQPLFYESLLLDLAAVTGGDYAFAPTVEPAVFMVDVGAVNRKLHGAAGRRQQAQLRQQDGDAGAGEGGAEGEAEERCEAGGERSGGARSGSGGGGRSGTAALVAAHDGGRDVATAATSGSHARGAAPAARTATPARGATRQRSREMAALCRLELRAVVAEGTERAEEYLRGVARMGDDAELTRLLQQGYQVSYVPHPWYKRMDVGGAARDREQRLLRSGSGARPSLRSADGGGGGGHHARSRSHSGGRGGPTGSSHRGGTAGGATASSRQGGRGGTGGGGRSLSPLAASRGTAWDDEQQQQQQEPWPLSRAAMLEDAAAVAVDAEAPGGGWRPATTATTASRGGPPRHTVVLRGGPGGGDGERAGLPPAVLHVLPGVNSADCEGNTPLMLAARNGRLACVRILLAAGAEHRRRNGRGQSAYDLARLESELASVALAAEQPAGAARKRAAAQTAAALDARSLLECARDGDLRRVRALVEGAGHAVNSANAYGMTALHFAVLKRDAALVRYLVVRGADVEARNNLGQTPASLVGDAVGELGGAAEGGGSVQDALLAALAEGPLSVARARHAAANEAAVLAAEERATAVLARRLRELTRGTTAAKAVQLALPPRVRPDFAPPRLLPGHGSSGGGSGVRAPPPPSSPASGGCAGGRRAPAAAPAQPHDPSAQLARPPHPPNAAALAELARSTAALTASWNRHALEYMSLQRKQVVMGAAADTARGAREGAVVDAERRRAHAGGAFFSQADADATVARLRGAGVADDTHGAAAAAAAAGRPTADAHTLELLSPGAATALWATGGARAAVRTRRASEPLVRVAAGLADPEALSAALRAHAPPPAPDDRKFDAWMRMRFGALR